MMQQGGVRWDWGTGVRVGLNVWIRIRGDGGRCRVTPVACTCIPGFLGIHTHPYGSLPASATLFPALRPAGCRWFVSFS